MRRRMRVALWLYPPTWRARYEREFAALLEDAGSGWREWWDVVRGGLQMRVTTWNFATVTAALAILGAAGAAGWSLSVPDTYVSTAVLRVANADPSTVLRLQAKVLASESLSALIENEDLYRDERQVMPIVAVIADMRNHDIRVRPLTVKFGDPPAFAIDFRYSDRVKAQRVVQKLAAGFTEGGISVQVLDPPTLPSRPSSPNRLRVTVFGFLTGLTASLLIFGVRRWPLVAASGVAAAAAALAIAFAIPDRWVSTAVLSIQPANSAVVEAVLQDDVLQRIIEKPVLNLYAHERATRPIAEVIRRMRERDLKVRQVSGNGWPVIEIAFAASDRAKAQAVVRELVTKLTELNVRQARRQALRIQTLEVVTPATFPQQPSFPNRFVILLFGLMLGIGAGAVWTKKRRAAAFAAAA